MKQLQKFKPFIKYRALLLQQYNDLIDKIDEDNLQEDLRKIGLTFVGASLLGLILQKADIVSGILLLLIGLTLWYVGLIKRGDNE